MDSTAECKMDSVALEWNMDWVAVWNGTWMGSTGMEQGLGSTGMEHGLGSNVEWNIDG